MIVVVALVLNLCPGLFVLSFSNAFVGEPYASCEESISDDRAVRIVAYPEQGVLAGAHFFFLATQDAGNTWTQIMHFRHDDPVEPACEAVRSLDADNYWVWMGWQLAVTHDSGRTWAVWQPQDTWESWDCCNHGLIRAVSFESAQTGRMILSPLHGDEASPLHTDDGGRTWEEIEE